mgnify:CR=1 FL=1
MNCDNPREMAMWAKILFTTIIVVSGPVMLIIYNSNEKFKAAARKKCAEQAEQQAKAQEAKDD